MRRLAAPVLDLLCLVVFVLGGAAQHGIGGGIGTYLTILWPLAVGWYALAWPSRLYARSVLPEWTRLVLTWVPGLTAGLLLRALVTHHQTPIAFIAVTFGFVGATTGGWRLLATGLSRLRARRRVSSLRG